MNLRPYQQEAVDYVLPRRRAMVVAPAGSGKTIIGAAAVAAKNPHGFAWTANTMEQVQQAESALLAAGRTGGLVCCMMARPDLSDCDLVVVDECHHAPAAVWDAVIHSARPEATIWGLTATPFGDDEERNQQVKELFQDFAIIGLDEVKAGGHLVDGVVKLVDLDRFGEYDADLKPKVEAEVRRRCARFRFVPEHEHRKRATWQITSEHLQENLKRNAAAVNIAKAELEQGETVLILVGSIEHGERLAEQIPGAVVLNSKLPAKVRRQRIEDLRSGKIRCAVATSLADEGMDIPAISVCMLVAPGRSATKTIQRTGRAMRPHKGKTTGVVYDFVDRGLVYAHAQHKARMRTYRELGYTIETV